MKTGTNKKTLSLILASLLCVALTVFGIGNLSVFGNRQTKAAAGNAVAKVGETEYADLSSAFSALDANNYSLELLDEAAWAESTPVYWKTSKGNGYVATFAAALTASYMSDGGAITIVCRPGADVGTMTHGHVEDDLTVYGNGAYVSDGECDLEVDTFPYSRTTGRQVTSGSYLTSDVTITAYKLDNLGVWGQRNTGHTVNVNLYECNGKAIDGKTNFQRVYISGKTGVNNYNIVGCKFITASTSLYSNADGKIVIKGCSFTGSKAPVNFNHKTDGDMTLTVENCSFASCGDDAEWKGFAAPVRFVNSGNGTMGTVVDGCAFENTVGANGDVLVGDGRESKASGDVAVSVKNTAAKVSVQQPGYYTSAGTVADESKAENATTVSDTPYISGENYTTIELTYGNEVAAEDIAAAKKLYEGVAYSTNKAANEAYMALYGVTWDKGYLDVTDNAAPLRKYAGVSGSVTEVKYLVHGEMAGFTSLQSNGNNIDSTVGGNHQIARTSYTILGVSDKDGNKARITDGNVQAYVAGGYDNMFAVSGTLKIENIEFTSTTSTTVGASAMNATGNLEKEVFGAKMVITDCIFRGRLYVYDNFDNAGKMTYEISKCVFDGSNYSGDSNAYAIFAQCRGGNELYIQNNKISGYARGINIDHPTVKATISENEISVTDKGRSCVQLSSLTSATVSNNELVLDGGNAITLHEKLLALSTVPEITFKNNNVTGTGYLVYDDAKANGKEFTNKNLALTFGENTIAETVDTTKGVKGSEVYDNKGYVNDVVNYIYGSVNNPYTLEAFSKLTRAEYIAAQEKLGGTIYVDVGDYAYDKYGVLGNGTADNNDRDTTKLNCYNQNGYLGEGNDGANGKNVVFVGSSVTNNVTGYTSIDNIGTYLLLAVPAYTNVTFKDITFNGVFSFNYQMYTGPWSQLGELKFDGCTFNSLIVGGLAAQGLNFTGCTFNSFTNSVSANNSNPIWIRPAYGNWSKGDNEGQGNDFKSLTSVVFAGNTVASTRPVKFERIAQWEMQTKVEVTGNSFDMASDGSNKNVGLYFGANAKFDLVLDNNKAAEGSKTVALYTAVYNAPDGKSYAGLPAGSTVKNAAGGELNVKDDAVAWKTTDKITLATTQEVVAVTNAKGVTVKFATIDEALAAAADGDTITLLENVTVEGKQIVIDKNVTIDLNGKTLKVSKYTAKAAQIDVTGELTVKDGAEGGVICSDYTGTAGLVVCVENGGKFTLESGTITTEGMANSGNAVKIATGGEFVMNGGTLKADLKRNNFIVNIARNATFTMNGGSIIAEEDTENTGDEVTGINGAFNANITVNGGSIDAQTAIFARSSNLSVTGGDYKGKIAVKNGSISGGTFDTLIDYRYLADGYVLEEKPDGTYGLKEGKYVAVIGTVGYESLQAAINAAAENETVKLVADTNENVTIEAGKNITLDLNGFTLNGGTGTAKAAILNYGTVVIKDSSKAATGTIKRDDKGTVGETSYYVIRNLGTMTIESGNIENNSGYRKANSTGAMIGSSLICNGDDDPGAMLTIKGGKLAQLNFIAIKNGALGNLIVTGGEITSENSAIQNWFKATITGGTIKGQLWTDAYFEGESVGNTVIGEGANFSGEIVMDITGSVVPTLKITGGTLNVTNWRITNACETAGGKPQVSGGTFTSAVDESYCAAGFIPTLNEDGTYGVKEGKFLVRVNGKGFETLAEAIKAAADGDTITILENIEVSEQIVIEKAVTIDLGGNTISNAYSGGSYSMLTKADVTIKNGTYKSTVSSARGIGACANFNAEGLTVETAGLVGIALSTANMTCNVTDSVIKAGYAIANFADDNKLIVNNSQVLGTGCGIYHNGTNKRFAFTATDSKVVAGTEEKSEANNSTTGIYVSGSAKDESEYSNITLTGCTVMGGTAIEGKFVNLTLTDCIVTATASETSYVMNNNGATSLGFAVVITDNTTLATGKTPEPKGTIIITGDEGNYKGVVGLGNLASVKETYNDFVDASYAVSGGTFSSAIGEDYCAEGFIPTENEDGTFGVKVGKYVAQYTYKKVTYKFETLQEAINAAVDYSSQIVLKALGDIEITETIAYAKTKSASVLLDLGGYTLTAKGCTAIQVHKGNLYVENGTITAVDLDKNSAVIRVGSDDTAYAGSNPLLNIGKGTVVSAPESYGILVYGSATKGGKLTVGSTGIVEATGSKPAIAGKSDEVYNTGNTAITITGTAKVIAANSYAIYHPQAGTLGIQSNATIEGLGGIQMSAGTLNVLGNPVITATGNAGTKTEVDGVILDAAAISAVNRGFVGGAPVVNVKETPVITANGEVITAYSWTNGAESEWSEASVSVSGGTYNKLFNDKYLAVRAYFEHKDGAYNVELEKVAEVNKIRYDSLKAAINAAAAGDTVKILQDFEISEQIIISKAITIDLNGKTLTNSYYNAGNVQAYGMSINATVTIKNGTYIASSEVARGICVNRNKQLIVENATIEAKGQVGIGLVAANAKCDIIGGAVVKADYAVASFGDGTTVNVENSQVVGTGCAIYHNGTNKNFTLGGNGATIIAGTEEVSEGNNTATGIYVSGSATSESEYSNITLTGCTVKGGTAIEGKFVNLVLNDCNVTATATETSYNANANGAATKGFAVAVTDNATTGTPAPAGSIEITGNGVYNGIVGLGNLASVKESYSDFVDASYAVSGGTFSSAIGEDYCADGFIVSKNAQGTYSVKEGEYFFAIGEDKFGSVEDASAVAKSGETIKLLKDYTSDKAANAATVIDLTGITFDLNGCTFTANNFAYVFEGTGGVIRNGKMATSGSYALFIGDNGETTSFTVTDVELTGGINVYNATGVILENLTVNGTDYYAVWLDSGAEATVKSGNYTAGAVAAVGVTVFEGKQSVLTIEGGKIDANGKPLMLANGGKLLVKGGEFTNIGKVLNEDKDNSIEISGGTFSVAVDEKYCAAGFIPTENEDGTYGVKVGEYVVKIGEVKYDSLNAAEKAAKDGDTITLIKDVVLTEQVATGKAITIDGAGFEIKAAAKLASASGKAGMFYRTTSAKGTLTFKNVTLNGNGVSKIFLNEGGAGETVFDTVVSTNGGGMAYGSGIHISGGGSHATIKNSTLTGSTGTMELNNQNYYAANDLWVGGNVEVIVENSVIGTVFVNTTGAPATSVHGHLIVRGDATEIGYIAGENDVADKNGSIGSLTTIEGGSVDTIFDGGLYEISGGTFKTELKDEWLKDGFNAVRNEDGTYGVKTVFHVSDRYNGSALAEFSSLDEAFAYAAENNYKFIVVNGTYVLKSDLVIPDGKYFEVTGTLTIGEGVKVTVNKTSKRMSVLTGGKVINNGTILLLGEDGEGYFMINGGTLEGNSLTAPEGYAIAKNGNSYRIINIATAGVKVEYEDGSVQYFNGTVLTENAKKITLLRDFEGVINIVGTSSVTYNVEIDLGGHTITKNISMGSGVITVGYANVVIKNGTVVSTSTNGTNKPALKVYSHGNVTVADDVTLDGGTVQPAIYLEGGEVALYGTATSKGGYAITTHGLNEHNTVITIKDGATVTAENGAAIYNPHGDLIIEGGVITGKVGVQICAGSLSISGNAQISATGAVEAHEGDGAVFDGSAVSIIDRAGAYTGLVSIEITGGTFTSAHGKAIRAFAYDDTTETEFDNSSKVVKVSGGTFSSEVDASLIKDGCKLISVNGAYGVFEKQILGASVTLGEDISFNYYVKTKTENTVVVVKYMKNGTMTEETLTEFVAMTNSKYAGKYVFRGITPQMIARGITVVYTDGSAYDIIENYSVADYLERAYKNANNTAETKQLVADAMYYGLAAMKYRKADEADIADVQARITELGMTQSAVEMTDSSLREGENIVQVSVRFDNANSLVFAVKNSVFEANPGYKYYIGNTEITEWNTTLIAGYHVYTTEALRAVEYVGKAFTVTVKSEGKVVQTLSTDVGSYCARIAASESYTAELKELAKATYAYGVSAKAYANRSNNG